MVDFCNFCDTVHDISPYSIGCFIILLAGSRIDGGLKTTIWK